MNATSLLGFRKSLCLLTMGVSFCLLGGCSDNVSDAKIEYASLADTRALILDKPGSARAIDTRTPQDFAAGHIPGALNLDLADVPADKDSIDPALTRYKTLIVYGEDAGSGSAPAMTKRLMRAGHKGPKLFSGGMAEWRNAGLQVEKGGPAARQSHAQ